MKRIICILTAALLLLCTGCTPGEGEQPAEYTGHSFTWQDTVIRLHEDAAPVLDALGAPKGYTEEASCAFEGLDKTYYYGSFYLTTYPVEGKDYIFGIWFADDTVATEEGIRIGSTQAEVEAVFGPECFNGANTCTAVKGDTKLTVILTDGLVSAVRYDAVIS